MALIKSNIRWYVVFWKSSDNDVAEKYCCQTALTWLWLCLWRQDIKCITVCKQGKSFTRFTTAVLIIALNYVTLHQRVFTSHYIFKALLDQIQKTWCKYFSREFSVYLLTQNGEQVGMAWVNFRSNSETSSDDGFENVSHSRMLTTIKTQLKPVLVPLNQILPCTV